MSIQLVIDKLWKCQIDDDLLHLSFMNSIVHDNINFSWFFIFFKKKVKLFFQLLIYIKIIWLKKFREEVKIFQRIKKIRENSF